MEKASKPRMKWILPKLDVQCPQMRVGRRLTNPNCRRRGKLHKVVHPPTKDTSSAFISQEGLATKGRGVSSSIGYPHKLMMPQVRSFMIVSGDRGMRSTRTI